MVMVPSRLAPLLGGGFDCLQLVKINIGNIRIARIDLGVFVFINYLFQQFNLKA